MHEIQLCQGTISEAIRTERDKAIGFFPYRNNRQIGVVYVPHEGTARMAHMEIEKIVGGDFFFSFGEGSEVIDPNQVSQITAAMRTIKEKLSKGQGDPPKAEVLLALVDERFIDSATQPYYRN